MNTSTTTDRASHSGAAFDRYIDRVAEIFYRAVTEGSQLFIADTHNLFELYLSSFPEIDRQFHNCNACKRFIDTYGSIVTISKNGDRSSPIWETVVAPHRYAKAVESMVSAIEQAPIKGVFRSAKADLGVRQTGEWSHYALQLPPTSVCNHPTQSAAQGDSREIGRLADVAAVLGDI